MCVNVQVADETKMKALAKLITKEPRLLALLEGGTDGGDGVAGGRVGIEGQVEKLWDAEKKELRAAPDWGSLARTVGKIQTIPRHAAPAQEHGQAAAADGTSAGERGRSVRVGEDEERCRRQPEWGDVGVGRMAVDRMIGLQDVQVLRSLLQPLLQLPPGDRRQHGGERRSNLRERGQRHRFFSNT